MYSSMSYWLHKHRGIRSKMSWWKPKKSLQLPPPLTTKIPACNVSFYILNFPKLSRQFHVLLIGNIIWHFPSEVWNNKKHFKRQIEFPTGSEFTSLSMHVFPAWVCEPYHSLKHLTQTSASFPSIKAFYVDWLCVTPNSPVYLCITTLYHSFSGGFFLIMYCS